ncbi:MAG: hypothetical protein II207_03225 [Clostridia bacterium]|jgi:hypothetical protein|nr:hypothetical protein [Clostridia bacterium]
MRRIELIEKYESMLQECAMAGVDVQDWKHAEIYRYVHKLRGDGNKMDYCVRMAMIRYVISEATVWRILRSMDQPVTINL